MASSASGGKDPARRKRGVDQGHATDGSAVAAPRFRNDSSGFCDYSPSVAARVLPPPPRTNPPGPVAARSLLVLACSGSAPSAWSLRYSSRHDAGARGFLPRTRGGRGLFLACGRSRRFLAETRKQRGLAWACRTTTTPTRRRGCQGRKTG